LIFIVAAGEALGLLDQMRVENQILRDASLERSHRLAAIRSYVLLSRRFVVSEAPPPELRRAWSRAIDDLSGYRSSTREEAERLNQLRGMLERQSISREETAIVEIATRADDADARQRDAASSEIQRQFENMGRRLRVVLLIAVGATILLAAGCLAYILR